MRINLEKFGKILFSQPDGREAYLILESDFLHTFPVGEIIEIDFAGATVLTPGWADEVLTPLTQKFKNIKLLNAENSSVQATLKTLREYSDLKI